MSKLLRGLLLTGVLLTLLLALALGAVLAWGLPELAASGTVVTINGERIGFTPVHPGHWLMASLGVLAAAAVIVVVVLLAVLLGTAVPLLLVAFGIAVAIAVLALVTSPLILLGWWLWKRSDKPTTMSA